MFDSLASRYDRINRILSLGLDLNWRRALLAHLPDRSSLRLLDVATGTGDQLLALIQDPRIEMAIGVDLASEMLQIGKQKLEPFRRRVELCSADACHLPFSNEQFDVTTISFGIRNVNDPKRALREMARVLKVGGKAIILEFSVPRGWIRPFYLFYLRTLLPKIGGWLSRNPEAYRYLNRTIESFPSGEIFLTWMRESGFTECRAYPLTLGAVTLYVGHRGSP